MDGAGRVRFPGGRAAWSANPAASDDEILWRAPGATASAGHVLAVDFEALAALTNWSGIAGALDTESARLLARNFASGAPSSPYFTTLAGLGSAEFQALDSFTRAAAAKAPAEQELTMGLWHSAAALIVLGRKSGRAG